MKKEVKIICSILLVGIVLTSFVSAFSFSELWGKITGKITDLGNSAKFVSQEIPSIVETNQIFQVTIVMENDGTSSWTEDSHFRLGSQNPQDNLVFKVGRITLNKEEVILPGEKKEFKFNVTAPSVAGDYNFQWRMLRELVEWFGEFSDNQVIKVVTPVAPVTPVTPIINITPTKNESNTNYSCYDSDDGINAFEAGSVKFTKGSSVTLNEDICILAPSEVSEEKDYVRDYFCREDGVGVSSLDVLCEYGCQNGACSNGDTVPAQNNTILTSCDDVISFMKNPTDLTLNDDDWKLSYNESYAYDDNAYFYAGWYIPEKGGNDRVWLTVSELSDQDAVEQELNMALDQNLCQKQTVYPNLEITTDTEYPTVYVCKNIWRLIEPAQEVSPEWDYSNDFVAIWTNDNKLFSMEFSKNDYYDCRNKEDCDEIEEWNHKRKQEDLINSIDKLLNNKGERIKVYLDYTQQNFVNYFVSVCSSNIEQDYESSWTCKQEPVICPPHGEQKQVCTRWNNKLYKEEQKETIMYCNPGICSGCSVPRWFECYLDNKCIEYGFRFKQQTSWNFEDVFINDTTSHSFSVADAMKYASFNLVVYENNTAYLSFDYYDNEELKTVYYKLEEGKTYDWGFEVSSEELNYTLTVNKIYYNSENYDKSYVALTFNAVGNQKQVTPQYLNMYCDIDGNIKEQKVNSGEECQNNYECFSNLCSYGECVGLKEMIQEIKGFRAFFTKILCKMGNLMNEDAYLQCVVEGTNTK